MGHGFCVIEAGIIRRTKAGKNITNRFSRLPIVAGMKTTTRVSIADGRAVEH